ncbi:hypothetical protein [Lewinella sp. 4G2]|uniref:hypothetical protein n=1 Tax=Lewinella sp. 4G2 TaxID=1803372 RepID=UPI0007B46602|nr:hypothetical protein [Lewinella sp. 4G2]OAV44793.1 hypothetical protein A3850_009960 [Lewinella sp. 4G2]
MRFFLTMLILLTTVSSSFGQAERLTSKRSAPFEVQGISYPRTNTLELGDARFIVTVNLNNKKVGKGYTLIKYDDKTGDGTSVPITFEYEGKPMSYHNTKIFNGGLYIFSYFFNKKDKTAYLFGQEYDTVSLKPKGKLKLMSKLPGLKGKANGTWKVLTSDNESLLAVQTIYDPEKKNENGKVIIEHFDNDLKVTTTLEPDLPVSPSGELRLGVEILKNDGTIVMYLKEEAEKTARNKNPKGIEVIYQIYKDGSTPSRTPYKLDRGDKRSGIWSVNDEKNTLTIYGAYGPNTSLGYYVMDFDLATTEKTKEIIIPFALSESGYGLKKSNGGDGNADDLEDLTDWLRPNHLIHEPDGSMFILGLQRYSQEVTSGNRIYNIYTAKNITAAHVLPDGEVNYIQTIPMHATYAPWSLGLNTVKVSAVDGALYLSFVDTPKNRNRFSKEPYKAHPMSVTCGRLVTITPDGTPREHLVYGEKGGQRNMIYPLTATLSEDKSRIYTYNFIGKNKAAIHRIELQ